MTKKKLALIERGLQGSIQKQEKVFFDNFITKALFHRAYSLGKKKNSL